jgi:hypothetical protein
LAPPFKTGAGKVAGVDVAAGWDRAAPFTVGAGRRLTLVKNPDENPEENPPLAAPRAIVAGDRSPGAPESKAVAAGITAERAVTAGATFALPLDEGAGSVAGVVMAAGRSMAPPRGDGAGLTKDCETAAGCTLAAALAAGAGSVKERAIALGFTVAGVAAGEIAKTTLLVVESD